MTLKSVPLASPLKVSKTFMPWNWAMAGVLLGTLGTLLMFAPAQWLAQAVALASQDRLQLQEARGTVWQGSAQVVLTGGTGSRDAQALPGRIAWKLRPFASADQLSLRSDCCMPTPMQLSFSPAWDGGQLRVSDTPSTWPAALLTGLGAPWNTLQPEGDLAIVPQQLSLNFQHGRWLTQGHLRARVGSKIDVEWPSSRRATLTVVGIYDDSSVVGNSLIDQSTYGAYFTGPRLDFFAAASVTSGASVQTVQRDVQTYLLDAAPAVTVQDKAEFQKSREQIVDTFVITINVLLALAVFIALIGIANTLALSVYERTREIGLMRAVGMLRAQTRSMVRWESVLVAVFGALLGVALGIVLGSLVALALPSAFVSTVTIPAATLVAYVVAAVVAGMAAAFFPARRAARMNVLEAIAQS